MKNIAKSLLLVLTVALCVTAAQAQSETMLKADVPFGFIVGNQNLPAGEYTVKQMDREIEGWYGPDGHAFILRTIPLGKEASLDTTKLVFLHTGDQYFLTEVWSNGVSHEVHMNRSQQQIARSGNYKTVAVLMTSRR
jgi:hypothetical protein